MSLRHNYCTFVDSTSPRNRTIQISVCPENCTVYPESCTICRCDIPTVPLSTVKVQETGLYKLVYVLKNVLYVPKTVRNVAATYRLYLCRQ